MLPRTIFFAVSIVSLLGCTATYQPGVCHGDSGGEVQCSGDDAGLVPDLAGQAPYDAAGRVTCLDVSLSEKGTAYVCYTAVSPTMGPDKICKGLFGPKFQLCTTGTGFFLSPLTASQYAGFFLVGFEGSKDLGAVSCSPSADEQKNTYFGVGRHDGIAGIADAPAPCDGMVAYIADASHWTRPAPGIFENDDAISEGIACCYRGF